MGTRLKLEIGDKVRIIKFPNPDMVGEMCEVTEIPDYPTKIICRVKAINIKHWNCLMYPNEIELRPRKGEQLMFPFMETSE